MELKEIVRRLKMKQSIKAIKRETGKHRSVIRRVPELAEQEGWLEDDQLPSEQQLQERYHDQRHAEQGTAHPLDAHREQIAEWLPGYHPAGENAVTAILARRFSGARLATLRSQIAAWTYRRR